MRTMSFIITCIRNYLWGDEVKITKMLTISDTTVQNAINAQKSIGPQNFRLGRISKEWKTAQSQYADQNNFQGHIQQQWIRSVCKIMITASTDIWKQRNKELHETDAGKQLERANLQKEIIRARNEYVANIQNPDKNLLDISIDNILPQPNINLRMWTATFDKEKN